MTLDFSSKVQNLALIFGIDLAQPLNLQMHRWSWAAGGEAGEGSAGEEHTGAGVVQST